MNWPRFCVRSRHDKSYMTTSADKHSDILLLQRGRKKILVHIYSYYSYICGEQDNMVQGATKSEYNLEDARPTFETPKYARWPRDPYTAPNSEYVAWAFQCVSLSERRKTMLIISKRCFP